MQSHFYQLEKKYFLSIYIENSKLMCHELEGFAGSLGFGCMADWVNWFNQTAIYIHTFRSTHLIECPLFLPSAHLLPSVWNHATLL